MKFDLLIIGGGVAGTEAALAARQVQPSKSVALVSCNPLTYPAPDPMAILGGFVRSAGDVRRFGAEALRNLGVTLFEGYEATSADRDRRTVRIKNSQAEQEFSLEYGKMVIATGSIPAVPSVEGCGLPGVFTVKWFEDASRLFDYAKRGMRAFVVGAGIIGLETAETLAERGLNVTIVEMLPHILGGVVEPDLSEAVARQVKVKGLKIVTDTQLDEIGGGDKVRYVSLEGQKSDADVVVFTTGMRPNTTLASQIGLELAENNAIKTGNRMETSFQSIYAAGDCAETLDFVTGKPVSRPLGSVAAESARIAGSNAVGVEKTYNGFIRTQYARIFKTDVGSMGLTTSEANRLGLRAEAVNLSMRNSSHTFFSLALPTKSLMKATVSKDVLIGVQSLGFRRNAWTFWAFQFFQELIKGRQEISSIRKLGFKIGDTDSLKDVNV